MSIEPRWQNTFKEKVKSVLALVFVILIIMTIGYVAGKRVEEFQMKGTIQRIEKSLEGINEKFKTLDTKVKSIDKKVKSIEKKLPLKNSTIARMWCGKYFPASQVNNCVAVSLQESGGDPNQWSVKINRHKDGHLSRDCGLMQINIAGTTCPDWILDPNTNMQIALRKWKASGWCPWLCNYGKYLCSLQKS